jgi:hypothetical protein
MAATTALLIASGLATGYGAIKNAQAQREAGDFQADQEKFNSQIADLQSADATARGEQAVQNAQVQARQIKGQQKAALAGNGVAVDSGSAADILAETDKNSSLDILTIRDNAAKEAFGYKAQSVGFATQADVTRKSARSMANSTLLTGGANVLKAGADTYASTVKANPSQVVNNYYGGKA